MSSVAESLTSGFQAPGSLAIPWTHYPLLAVSIGTARWAREHARGRVSVPKRPVALVSSKTLGCPQIRASGPLEFGYFRRHHPHLRTVDLEGLAYPWEARVSGTPVWYHCGFGEVVSAGYSRDVVAPQEAKGEV